MSFVNNPPYLNLLVLDENTNQYKKRVLGSIEGNLSTKRLMKHTIKSILRHKLNPKWIQGHYKQQKIVTPPI